MTLARLIAASCNFRRASCEDWRTAFKKARANVNEAQAQAAGAVNRSGARQLIVLARVEDNVVSVFGPDESDPTVT